MKRLLFILGVFPLIVSCVTDGKTGSNASSCDSDTIVAEQSDVLRSVIGSVGEGTTMHELELLADNDSVSPASNQPQYFSYDNDAIGGVAAGDRVVVSWFGTNKEDVIITNLTSLSHLWTLDNTDGSQAIQLDDDFNATVYGMDEAFEHWTVNNGTLELSCGDRTVTYDIQLLTEDSLILANDSETLKLTKRN